MMKLNLICNNSNDNVREIFHIHTIRYFGLLRALMNEVFTVFLYESILNVILWLFWFIFCFYQVVGGVQRLQL